MCKKIKNYGMSYMGSKSSIVEELIQILPTGKRFVDLFGGGGAVTHAVCEHINKFQFSLFGQKWESVLYNDYNPLVVDLFKKSINGEYNYKNFKPVFITRDMFQELKSKDGYVKYIWSFGNNGRDYLFNKEIEKDKKSLHNAIIFDVFDDNFYKILPNFKNFMSTDIKSRRLEIRKYLREVKKRCDVQQLERLERLQQLEQLEQLERLETTNISYLEYHYQNGDVVYCDIPYQNTCEYDESFNHKQFYDWAYNADFPVYFSSYEISDNRFKTIFEIPRRSTLSSSNNNCYKVEKVYFNSKE